jgi:hypothetical protein
VAAAAVAPEIPRLFRFDPWTQRFEPARLPDSVQLPKPGMPQPLALEPDAFVWMDDDGAAGQLIGLRLGTRNRFTQDLSLVLSSDPIETRPQHLVPERPIGQDVSYDGRLTLSGPVTIHVADTDYGDVTIKLHLVAGEPPQVLLGIATLGGAECPWPDGVERGGDFELPTVVRQGNRAQLLFHGGAQACPVEAGRLELGLRARNGVSVIQQLDVLRGARLP